MGCDVGLEVGCDVVGSDVGCPVGNDDGTGFTIVTV